MNPRDIDWNEMWRQARARRTCPGKGSGDWDRKADSFANRNLKSRYPEKLIEIINPEPSWTVLDIGSGPGTLSIPLAGMVRQVTAMDYSPRMLEILQEQAEKKGLLNLNVLKAAWEDDWDALGVPVHDVTIASRSLSVDDLEAALKKMISRTGRRGVISDRVGHGPFDPEIFRAVGRELSPGPDYIYTLNLLYQLGINAGVEYITLEKSRNFSSKEDALESCKWMLGAMTPEEEDKLADHVSTRLVRTGENNWRLDTQNPPRWAIISWEND